MLEICSKKSDENSKASIVFSKFGELGFEDIISIDFFASAIAFSKAWR